MIATISYMSTTPTVVQVPMNHDDDVNDPLESTNRKCEGEHRSSNNLRIVSRKRRFSTIVQPIAANVVMSTKEECHSHELMNPSILSGSKRSKPDYIDSETSEDEMSTEKLKNTGISKEIMETEEEESDDTKLSGWSFIDLECEEDTSDEEEDENDSDPNDENDNMDDEVEEEWNQECEDEDREECDGKYDDDKSDE
jgi:hypothetical protein